MKLTKEQYYYHLLALNFYLPNQSIYDIFQRNFSLQEVWEKFKANKNNLQIPSKEEVENELEKIGVGIITFNDENFPLALKHIPDFPLGFYFKGEIEILKNKMFLAIVGTRKATQEGKTIAYNFSSELSRLGVVIVSGLAMGIDESAHRGAIDNNGKTIGILGLGIQKVLEQNKLASKVNLLISEFHPQAQGLKFHFPLRNRLIAALAQAVLVIEAPVSSGALITANLALDYGKEVLVVPGSIFNINYVGSNNLLKQGARPVTNLEDILEVFNLKIKSTPLQLLPEELEILNLIKQGYDDLNSLLSHTGNSQRTLSILALLEIKGIVKNIGGKIKIIWAN